jgi:hypothetical protein
MSAASLTWRAVLDDVRRAASSGRPALWATEPAVNAGRDERWPAAGVESVGEVAG